MNQKRRKRKKKEVNIFFESVTKDPTKLGDKPVNFMRKTKRKECITLSIRICHVFLIRKM